MPVVRILIATPYEPTAADSPKCYGQLRLRATTITKDVVVEVTSPDGTTERVETTQTTCGPMERYFPVGAKPELNEAVATAYIAAGIAEAVDEPEARFISGAELNALLVDVKAI